MKKKNRLGAYGNAVIRTVFHVRVRKCTSFHVRVRKCRMQPSAIKLLEVSSSKFFSFFSILRSVTSRFEIEIFDCVAFHFVI